MGIRGPMSANARSAAYDYLDAQAQERARGKPTEEFRKALTELQTQVRQRVLPHLVDAVELRLGEYYESRVSLNPYRNTASIVREVQESFLMNVDGFIAEAADRQKRASWSSAGQTREKAPASRELEAWRRTFGDQSPYDVLKVPKACTKDQLKTAFRSQALKVHPDRNGGDPLPGQKLNAAYAFVARDRGFA